MSWTYHDVLRATIDDCVRDLLFFNRKEDEELPIGAIEQAIKDEEISTEEIVDMFRKVLTEALED